MKTIQTSTQALEVITSIMAREHSLKEYKAEWLALAECRTFAQAEEVIANLRTQLIDEEEAEEVLEEAKVEPLITLRDQVKAEVLELLEERGSATFKIATLIGEVKEDFDNSSSMLLWAKEELGLAKAQVYKYLKIASTFCGEVAYTNVAMRVLSSLASYKHFEHIEDQCLNLAEEGKLDTKAANALMDEYNASLAPTPKEPVKPVEPATTSTTSLPSSIPTLDEEDNDGDEGPTVAPVNVDLPKIDSTDEAHGDDYANLCKSFDALTLQLDQANKRIAELTQVSARETKVHAAPKLPQFNNACLYARLGLGQVESKSKKAIKTAYRELVKLGYGEGHECHESIQHAFTELSKDAK